MKSLLVSILAGLVFFSALSVAMIAGLPEPYVTILVIAAGVAVFALTYLRASRAKRERDE